jgi:hypothetical protein
MNRRSFAAGVTLALLALVSFAGPVAAGVPAPFRGQFEGDVTVTPVNPPVFAVVVEGTGRASQLGGFTVSVPHLVDRSTRSATGTYEFTTANGDTLTADFTGVSIPTDVPGVLHIVETATITGGTGRFAHATGSFTVERLYDPAAGTTTASFDGRIARGQASK